MLSCRIDGSVCCACAARDAYTRTQAHSHTHTHTRIHTHMHTHMHTQARTRTHTDAHTHRCTRACTCTRTCTHTRTHASTRVRARAHTHTHTHMHTCRHTYRCSYTHAPMERPLPSLSKTLIAASRSSGVIGGLASISESGFISAGNLPPRFTRSCTSTQHEYPPPWAESTHCVRRGVHSEAQTTNSRLALPRHPLAVGIHHGRCLCNLGKGWIAAHRPM